MGTNDTNRFARVEEVEALTWRIFLTEGSEGSEERGNAGSDEHEWTRIGGETTDYPYAPDVWSSAFTRFRGNCASHQDA
jgi:hypothetical protein